VIALGFIPVFNLRDQNLLLSEIQIAGEGELQDILGQTAKAGAHMPVELEEKSVEEIKEPAKDAVAVKEDKIPDELTQGPPKPQESVPEKELKLLEPTPVQSLPGLAAPPEERLPNKELLEADLPTNEESTPESPKTPPPMVSEQTPEDASTVTDQTKGPLEEVVEEIVPENDLSGVPPLEKTINPAKEVDQRALKEQHRRALLETINQVEKRKVKDKNRRKILEIAERMSQQKESDRAFNKMLNSSIDEIRMRANFPKGDGAEEGKGRNGSGGDGEAISAIINDQIRPYWNVPSGIRDAEKMIIEIELKLDISGEVVPHSVKIVDANRYANDYIFKAAADSARRAILEVRRFRIPRGQLAREQEFLLKFNVAEALKHAGG
jgi:hypothetical protein